MDRTLIFIHLLHPNPAHQLDRARPRLPTRDFAPLVRVPPRFAGLVRRAERQGWALVVVDLAVDMSTPTGGLLANVTASVAEWERKIIGLLAVLCG